MECSNKKEQEILIEISIKGEKDRIKEFLENNSLKKSDIDLAIRKCISKFQRNKVNHYECIKELFKHADLNYLNPDFENTNILMAICSISEISLIDLLFEQKYINNNENKYKLNKSNNKINKENNTYIEIDLFQVDKNNNNIFHHLFNKSKIENGIIAIITRIMNYKGNKYLTDKKKNLFTRPNNNGITPIVIILRNGWFDSLCLIFKYIDYQKYIIPCNNNNLIHCAIEGKNIKCIKKILSYCKSTDELKFKNKDGYTPLLYANKFKLFFIEKLIEQTEKYFNNKQIKNAILSVKVDNVYNILEKYIIIQNNNYINMNSIANNIEEIKNNINKDYNLILNNLYKYKINQYILSNDFISLPCEWNILFIKIQFEQILNYINNYKNISNNSNITISLKEFSKFFKNELMNFETKKTNEEMNYSIDIIIYNKIIFHYKLGDFKSLFSTINYYFNNIYQENNNENNYYKYITYVNISFILIEYFIFDNDEEISSLLIEQLENYLFTNYPKNNYNENNIIIKYLNTNEIYNPFNPTWDDTFCYLNLLKALYQIKYNKNIFSNDSNIDKDIKMNYAKTYLKKFKKSYNDCNYKEELINFNRLNGLYTICKCYYYYLSNNLNKSLYKISLIKKSLCEYSNEHKIFYFNSLGIINLKLKKYESSEYYFKTGIKLFKLINKVNNPNDDILFYKTEYLIKMKYNLCLALFYNKKYYEAFLICNEIKDFDIIKNNTYFWYRYGITALNLYLILLKKLNRNKQKEKEEKNYKCYKLKSKVYNGVNNFNKNNSDSNSSDSKKEKDELYIEFEKEYGLKNNLEKTNINNNFSNEKLNCKKKLFLEIGINKNKLNNKIQVDNNLDKASDILKYLKLSINCFKRAIILYKKPQFVIKRNKKMFEDIKSILDFYIKNGKTEENKDINKIYSNEYESIYNLNEINISDNSLFINCYMNLLFALSLNENYSEILILIKAFPRNLIENNFHIKEKLNYYKLNSMLNLSKYKEVETLIQNNKNQIEENQNRINYDNQEFDCYNTSNGEVETKMNHNTYFLLAEIFLNINSKNYEDALKSLEKMIGIQSNKKTDISKYYNQLMIYILSKQLKKAQVINAIKFRWNNFQNKYKNNINIINKNDKNG